MFKTGLYKPSQLSGPPPARNKISVTLYPFTSSLPDGDVWAEKILFHFADARGAFKRTYEKRFPSFDKEALRLLNDNFKSGEPLVLHDVAVSDGRTAADFFELLAPVFTALRYTASDYNPRLRILRKGRVSVTVSDKGDILEIVYPPFVFNAIHRDSYKFYPLNHLVRWAVQWACVRPLMKDFKSGNIKAEELFLFAPRVLALADGNASFDLAQHDVLNPLPRRYHVIRAMNILNLSYFTHDEFTRLIGHLYDCLEEGGLLITGSNEDAGSTVNGAIYKKTGQGFQALWVSGSGSPLNDMIVAYRPLAIAA